MPNRNPIKREGSANPRHQRALRRLAVALPREFVGEIRGDLEGRRPPIVHRRSVQNARVLKQLSRPEFAYHAMRPVAMSVAALLILIGVFGLTAILW